MSSLKRLYIGGIRSSCFIKILLYFKKKGAFIISSKIDQILCVSDGSFSLSPQQNVDMKDLEKGDAASVILSSQPLSNSSHSTASPKSFLALGISEAKGDKMISGFEGRALSPLTVMRFQPSAGDAMLSGLGYSDGDMGFDVPTLDGLLGAGGGPGLMLDGDMNQEAYMEAGQDLQLSPQAFHSSGDTFVVRESSPMTVLNDIKQGEGCAS